MIQIVDEFYGEYRSFYIRYCSKKSNPNHSLSIKKPCNTNENYKINMNELNQIIIRKAKYHSFKQISTVYKIMKQSNK